MREYKTSGNIAKKRLEEILLSEKMQASPEMMAQMKQEISAVLRRYMNAEHLRMDLKIYLRSETKQGAEHVKTIQIKGL